MKKHKNDTATFLKGAFILTIAGIIIKVLSAVYRVPFQNIVGDVGFYIYQQVYPFYGLAIVLCTVGFPVIISKFYAEYKEQGDEEGLKTFILAAIIVMGLVGMLLFVLLFLFAETIAILMNDMQLVPLIKAVSFVFLFVPFIALMRGVYQGRGDMIPTAVSQVGEQVVRVASILIVSAILVHQGYSLYATGTGAVFSAIAGLFTSSCILAFYFLYKKDVRNMERINQPAKRDSRSLKELMKIFFIQGSAVCVSGMLLIFIQLADSFNLYALLVSSGVEANVAKGFKGVYDRGQPLIQLGTVVATSISLAIIPFVSKAKARGDMQLLSEKIRLTFQLSIVIGVGASAGLWCIIEPTNIMLFQNNAGSHVLGVLALMIVFTSAAMTAIAILQGLGFIIFPAFVVLCGAIIKYMLNVLFVPHFGTLGGAFASVLTLIIVLAVLFIKLMRVVDRAILRQSFLFITTVATIILVVILNYYIEISNFLYVIIPSIRLAAAIQAFSAVIIGGFVYVVIIIRGGVFRMEELDVLPFGSKLILLLPKKYRLGDSK